MTGARTAGVFLVLAVAAGVGAVVVPEPLDVDTWPQPIQEQVRDQLVGIVGSVPVDYSTWTVPDMKAEVQRIVAEMEMRPGATVDYLKSVTVGTITIATDIPDPTS